MWLKVDDRFPEHEKVFVAGALLGRGGTGRVLAVWLEAACYAARNLTDGFLPLRFVETMRHDRNPLQVGKALVEARLWEHARGGYRIHDYHDYNPTREEAEAFREMKARAGREGGLISGRRRQAKAEVNAKQNLKQNRSTCFASACEADEADGQANAKQTAKQNSSSRARDPVPVSVSQEEKDGAAAAARSPSNGHHPSVRVLEALIRREGLPVEVADGLTEADLAESVKVAAARSGVPYDGESVAKAIESERFKRRHGLRKKTCET